MHRVAVQPDPVLGSPCLPRPSLLLMYVLEFDMGKGGDEMREEVEIAASEAFLDAAMGCRPC